METPGYTDEQRSGFRTRLGSAVSARTSAELEGIAAQIGRTKNSISNWASGTAPPPPPIVFRLEELLSLPPGELSRHLGFVPLDTETPCTVESAIASDPQMEVEDRKWLIHMYQGVVSRPR